MYYKDYEKRFIGDSDRASLIVASWDRVECIYFGGDNRYSAYIVDDQAEIPPHYHFVKSFTTWLSIYDDFTKTAHFVGDIINIYQAGSYGIIIQIMSEKELRKSIVTRVERSTHKKVVKLLAYHTTSSDKNQPGGCFMFDHYIIRLDDDSTIRYVEMQKDHRYYYII